MYIFRQMRLLPYNSRRIIVLQLYEFIEAISLVFLHGSTTLRPSLRTLVRIQPGVYIVHRDHFPQSKHTCIVLKLIVILFPTFEIRFFPGWRGEVIFEFIVRKEKMQFSPFLLFIFPSNGDPTRHSIFYNMD